MLFSTKDPLVIRQAAIRQAAAREMPKLESASHRRHSPQERFERKGSTTKNKTLITTRQHDLNAQLLAFRHCARMQNSADFERRPVKSGDHAGADRACLRTRCISKIAVATALIAALGFFVLLSVANPAKPADLRELAVVATPRHGSRGMATAGLRGHAITAMHGQRADAHDRRALQQRRHGRGGPALSAHATRRAAQGAAPVQGAQITP